MGTSCHQGSLVMTLDLLAGPKGSAGGLAVGKHRVEGTESSRDFCFLRLSNRGIPVPRRGRYLVFSEDYLQQLERQLLSLSAQGALRDLVVYFGVTSDPFFPFEGRFHESLKILKVLERYRPGLIVLQTRSPLLVLALPQLSVFGANLTVTIGIETFREDAVKRYSPGLPQIQERLRAANALRRFGISVTLQTAPLLPYGDWRRDAGSFAEVLAEHGDHLYIRGLHDLTPPAKTSPLVQSLARDRKFHWLRPDASLPLAEEARRLAPQKLSPPALPLGRAEQIPLFAQ